MPATGSDAANCSKQVKQDVRIDRGNHLPLISSIYSSTSKSAPSRIPATRVDWMERSCALLDQQAIIGGGDLNLDVVVHPEALAQGLGMVIWPRSDIRMTYSI